MKFDCEYAIIGGGVAGLSMAISLDKIGKDIFVFEQSPEIKGIGAGFGLAANAMQAFEYLGIRKEVEKIGFYTKSYNILNDKGNVLLVPNTQSLSVRYNQKNFTVHRADLHLFLLSKIEESKLLLGKESISFEQKNNAIYIQFADGSSYSCKYLIIADGVKSKLRQQLIPHSKPRYAGYTCWRATIDNTPIGVESGSETWGAKGRFGMTPLVGNRLYWYACVNSKPNNPNYKKFTTSDLQQQFANYHQPIPQVLQYTRDRDLIWGDIVDIKPLSRFAYGRIVLIGDAAHATTPNMGQGACQALEDVAVLTDEILKGDTIESAFIGFEKRRLARTKYIVDTSRRIGMVSQWSNPILINARNLILRTVPASWSEQSLKKLLQTDFMTINNTL